MSATIARTLAGAIALQEISESWRLDAELMLAEAIGRRREWLLAHSDESLEVSVLARYREMFERRLKGEPLAYIIGRKGFMELELAVNAAVLIPRPETELLVEWVLETLGHAENLPGFEGGKEAGREKNGAATEPLRLADLGTGSGAIALALASARPRWRFEAVDVDVGALAVARSNAQTLGLRNVDFTQASWCSSLAALSFDAVVSNPPYVADSDPHLQAAGLEYEPTLALAAGAQGMDCLREIVVQARRVLKRGGWLFLEHGFDQQQTLLSMLSAKGYEDVQGRRDYSGVDRMVAGRWTGRGVGGRESR